MMPLLTVCVPTIGRPGLERTLYSIRAQADYHYVEVIVAADVHNGTYAYPLVGVQNLCHKYFARYMAVDGGVHCVGQPQRQRAMQSARGTWIMFSQDDNELNNGAIRSIVNGCTTPFPRLFRAETTRGGGYVWRDERLDVGNADADGIVVPNEPARLGRWGMGYSGDFDFLQQTVAFYDGALVFDPQLIALKQK